MKIRPLYDRVVIKRVEEKGDALRGGLYIPDSAKEKPQEGEVLAVGKGKRLEDGTVVALDVQVGDRILFGKYSGSEITIEGTECMIMREDEILGILEATAGEIELAGGCQESELIKWQNKLFTRIIRGRLSCAV